MCWAAQSHDLRQPVAVRFSVWNRGQLSVRRVGRRVCDVPVVGDADVFDRRGPIYVCCGQRDAPAFVSGALPRPLDCERR